MKPAVLASSAALFLAACVSDGYPPAAPQVVVIGPPGGEPATPDGATRPAVRFAAAHSPDWIAATRDPRRPTGTSRALLVTKIETLERLLSATPQSAPDRPALLRRLAENYVELAASGGGEKMAGPAHLAAIKHYQRLHAEHPAACSAPGGSDPTLSTGCDDEVLYFLALEAERAGQLDTSRKSYLALLQQYPQSRYVPAAYLAFGELFLVEAVGDPAKLALCEQSYTETLKYPPPDNRWFGLAAYRLAQVYAKEGDDGRALANFAKAASWAAEHPNVGGLAASVRREVVASYARAGDPARARGFFSRFASGDELEQMLADLEKRRASP
jgi:TolA-binding protein